MDLSGSGDVESISLSKCSTINPYTEEPSYEKVAVCWDVDGESDKGFKLVWSKNEKPTYPCRSGDKYAYYSSSSTDQGKVYAFDGDGYYYVRVCEYLSGACGKYSNQIKVYLD